MINVYEITIGVSKIKFVKLKNQFVIKIKKFNSNSLMMCRKIKKWCFYGDFNNIKLQYFYVQIKQFSFILLERKFLWKIGYVYLHVLWCEKNFLCCNFHAINDVISTHHHVYILMYLCTQIFKM